MDFIRGNHLKIDFRNNLQGIFCEEEILFALSFDFKKGKREIGIQRNTIRFLEFTSSVLHSILKHFPREARTKCKVNSWAEMPPRTETVYGPKTMKPNPPTNSPSMRIKRHKLLDNLPLFFYIICPKDEGKTIYGNT